MLATCLICCIRVRNATQFLKALTSSLNKSIESLLAHILTSLTNSVMVGPASKGPDIIVSDDIDLSRNTERKSRWMEGESLHSS